MPDLTRSQSIFLRHEFAIRRLHSLLGIVPLGLFMCVHLSINASFLSGTQPFQLAVYLIHAFGPALPLVEWVGIFLPLLFHAIIGVWIMKTGRSNLSSYPLPANRRYVWQRWTGLIAFVFLMVHVLHLHGWFHFGPWLALMRPLGLAAFSPYNAGSSLAMAMDNWVWGVWPVFYLLGVWATVYHLANGLWTAGITWGLWLSPAGQRRASQACLVFGVLLAVVGTGAWWAAVSPGAGDYAEMRATEDEMFEAALKTGLARDLPEKRFESGRRDNLRSDVPAIFVEEAAMIHPAADLKNSKP